MLSKSFVLHKILGGERNLPKLTKSTVEGKKFLKSVFADDWFKENRKREIYLRYYSMPFKPKGDFYVPGLEGKVLVYSGVPFRVVVAHIAEQKYVSQFPWLIRSEAGDNIILVEKIDRELPDMDYVLISTPIRGTGDHPYGTASTIMDGFVGMLRLVGGNNLLRQLGSVEIQDSQIV
jgi:hypothetical protein